MISIIICSRNQSISNILVDNIKNTIGIEHELVIIDNSENKYTIFTAYNQGVKLSKYTYLCFMHEDIVFHSPNWGIKVVDLFRLHTNIGLIGVIGGHFIPNTPATWFSSSFCSGTILQGQINGHLPFETICVLHQWFFQPSS